MASWGRPLEAVVESSRALPNAHCGPSQNHRRAQERARRALLGGSPFGPPHFLTFLGPSQGHVGPLGPSESPREPLESPGGATLARGPEELPVGPTERPRTAPRSPQHGSKRHPRQLQEAPQRNKIKYFILFRLVLFSYCFLCEN